MIRIDLNAFPLGLCDFAILPSSSSNLVSNVVGFSMPSIIDGLTPARIYSSDFEGHMKERE